MVGIVMALLSILAAWSEGRNLIEPEEQFQTQLTLMGLRHCVDRYVEELDQPPRALQDLLDTGLMASDLEDGWNRPFGLRKEGGRTVVMSYGRDGKPGGTWLDFDLTTEDHIHRQANLSFRGFWLHDGTQGVLDMCLLSGLLGFLLSYWFVRPASMASTACGSSRPSRPRDR